MKKGILLILTGASSVGKGDIRDLLMADQELHLFYSISMTTVSYTHLRAHET